jgi:hypothetical protein
MIHDGRWRAWPQRRGEGARRRAGWTRRHKTGEPRLNGLTIAYNPYSQFLKPNMRWVDSVPKFKDATKQRDAFNPTHPTINQTHGYIFSSTAATTLSSSFHLLILLFFHCVGDRIGSGGGGRARPTRERGAAVRDVGPRRRNLVLCAGSLLLFSSFVCFLSFFCMLAICESNR